VGTEDGEGRKENFEFDAPFCTPQPAGSASYSLNWYAVRLLYCGLQNTHACPFFDEIINRVLKTTIDVIYVAIVGSNNGH
jgi:hypothetical protein